MDNLWGCVPQGSASGENVRQLPFVLCHPEIDEHWLIVVIFPYFAHHNVLQLDVPMHDAPVVQMLHGLAYELENSSEFLSRLDAPLGDELQEIHGEKLHDEVDGGFRVEEACELADVGVVEVEGNEVFPFESFLNINNKKPMRFDPFMQTCPSSCT